MLIFTATTSEGKELIIKFTRQYSEVAHNHRSDEGVAPRLYAVEKLSGGWMMVVTEFFQHGAYTFPIKSQLEPAILKEALRHAVDALRQGGFVHGDIRDIDVMVKREWDETKNADKVKLVDFNGAGWQHTTRYPPNANFEGNQTTRRCGEWDDYYPKGT